MHTFKGKSVYIHHNSDGSGDAIVRLHDSPLEMHVPCSDLVDFVAELVRSQRIDAVERMSPEELLGMKVR